MWQVENRTPFAADGGWVRDRNGSELWLVAVKATFDVRADGSLAPSPEQPPVLRVAQHHGEPGASSIKYEADLVLTKRTTDVIVIGHAYAPGGQPVAEIDAGFKVGPVQKLIRVIGDRAWGPIGATAPQPFSAMPLVYERAFGGTDRRSATRDKDWDWRNPVGTGYCTSSPNAAGVQLPNLEHASQLIGSWSDRPSPAGFGAVACHWQPRAGYAGTYDDQWMKTRQPLLPADQDDRFFQCAPPDQQTPDFLRGGEPVMLHNLTPSGTLKFLLPKLYLGFETRFSDATREVHPLRKLHTVILEPDFPRVSLVWHSRLPCHHKVQKLERTIVTLKADVSTGEPLDVDATELEQQ